MKELELYIHIPFCVQKCAYCDFLSAPAGLPTRIAYVKKLMEEIRTYAPDYREYQVSSIFIGGGTPSILTERYISELMQTVRECFNIAADAEITMECNPGTLSLEKTQTMVESGINRISLGLQSAQNNELKLLGRIHTFEEFLESFENARKAGCRNINVDLMSALPGQTPESWLMTLKMIAGLRPEHISAYSLIIEEGTLFYEYFHADDMLRERGEKPILLPSEEEERQMYELTEQFLAEKGYERYEISNYAKPGQECRHNIGYWTRKNYLGLGLGASSMIENVRFQNTSDLETYMQEPFSHIDAQELTRNEQIEEYMFLGLRMINGISRDAFEQEFEVPLESVYGDTLIQLKNQMLIEERERRIYLTPKGIDVSNMVLSEFLLG